MPPLDLKSLRAAYTAGNLTPTAVIDDVLRRIERHGDPAIFIHLLPRDELLEHARRVEARGPSDQRLYGVPFAIKDNIDFAGAPTTAACREFAYSPSTSATVAQRLIDAGAIPIGKTNLDQFATGLVGVRSPYGVPRNPFRADIIPGGSSSGSAVAVATGLVSFALGTDTAGSGRVPAGLNNLVGLKPTRGAWSTRGVVPACRSLDCVSVFALNCTDASEIREVCEAFDPDDAFSRARSITATRPDHAISPDIKSPVIGVPSAAQLEFFGDTESAGLFEQTVARARTLGADIVEIDFAPFRESAALLYQGPWIAERWAALRGFHREHADAFFPITRQIVEGGAKVSGADAFDGLYRLEALRRRAQREWEKMDVLLLPTVPRPYTLAEVAAAPIVTNSRLGTYTNFVNLLDLCALAVPAGFRRDGVPHGVTWVAPAWAEGMLLAIGRCWESGIGFREAAKSGHPAIVGSSKFEVGVDRKNAEPTSNSELPTRVDPVRLAVVGAHLSGLPLNHQLTELDAKLAWSGKTAPSYRLFALPNTTPAKPGLRRVANGGEAIAVEIWELTPTAFGQFVANVPAPMCIGTITLETGESVKGFLCEPIALEGADDITRFGGWRGYLAACTARQ